MDRKKPTEGPSSFQAVRLAGKGEIRIERDASGIPHIRASHDSDLYRGLGYCHATDRAMQMLLVRILGRGQASEWLEATDEMLAFDRYFRRMNWYAARTFRETDLSPGMREALQAYCAGINSVLLTRVPFELRMLGYQPDPWTAEDTVLMARLTGYIGLAQSQAEIERLLVQMVQEGVDRKKLEELFPGNLAELDEELLRKVKIAERIVPAGIEWGNIMPRMVASNSWVISGKKSASGNPIFANDPHLEINRLPCVWYEAVLDHQGSHPGSENRYVMGATMPGLPGVLVGRTNDVAWGTTYSFMDAIDSWIEDCRDGKFRRGTEQNPEWRPFHIRREVIRRKKKEPVVVLFHENEHGTLDGDPNEAGHYLATRWSSAESGAVSLNAMHRMTQVKNVEEAMDAIGMLELSFNWTLADRHGNIGYQMSGLLPKRREGNSGFVPLPGWEPENEWQGFVPVRDLPRCQNPEEGYFVTANNMLNAYGKAKPINVCMGPQRAMRIEELLRPIERVTIEDCFKIQYDVFSLQARDYMKILAPLLPDTVQGRILKAWDFRYNPESYGAYLFELFYDTLNHRVFGGGMGRESVRYLREDTGIFIGFYDSFDRVLLSERSEWFLGKSREQVFAEALKTALTGARLKTWGEVRSVLMKHLIFGGKLPRFLGFDRGPIEVIGGRATVSQGQNFRVAGRETSFGPSLRMVTDLGTDEARTNIPGGPSDRRFSRWYASDLQNWIDGKYKTLKRDPVTF